MSSDNDKFSQEVINLKKISQLYGYCEIDPDRNELHTDSSDTTIYGTLSPIADSKLRLTKIFKKEDVWIAFKNILGGIDKEIK